ncbi:hypothetical protein MTR67_018135 [Solanum verrucosum]|uniref:Major facilitator superfamily (MFS) profile domain-containing protein n=1 Tax=Solanum verrucosum TaxID=315347 RepID=A0AAF0QP76_SOLVR|nr:hypothetical protein MTR67_018135 [Solanum verrucosum]
MEYFLGIYYNLLWKKARNYWKHTILFCFIIFENNLILFFVLTNRKGLLSIVIVSALCATLSTFSPNYNLLLAVRIMVGVGVGGVPVYGSWFLESVPSQKRGMWTIICTCFWTIGTIHEALLALLLKLLHCGKNRGYAFSYVSKRVQLSLCSWDPHKRPTVIDALPHPFFQSCFYVRPSLRTKAAIAKTHPSVEQNYKWSFGLLHNPKPSINFSTVKSQLSFNAGVQTKLDMNYQVCFPWKQPFLNFLI